MVKRDKVFGFYKALIGAMFAFLLIAPSGLHSQSATINIGIDLDNYASETSWTLTGPSGNVGSGGPYNIPSYDIINEDFLVTESGTYTFAINDSYGDGMSYDGANNENSTARYRVRVDGTTEYQSADFPNFGIQSVHNFNITVGAGGSTNLIQYYTKFIGDIDYLVTAGTFRDGDNSTYASGASLRSTAPGDLTIPSGSTVQNAILYWGGSGATPDGSVTFDGQTVNADRNFVDDAFSGEEYFGHCANVTTLIQAQTTGTKKTYVMEDLTVDNTGLYYTYSETEAVWGLVVIYSNPSITQEHEIYIYDGWEMLWNGAGGNPNPSSNRTFNLSGITIGATGDADITSMIYEGDTDIVASESISVNGTIISSGNTHGSTSNVSGVGSNYPPYGLDIDRFDASNYVQPNDNSLSFNVSTGGDMVHISTIVLRVDTDTTPAPATIGDFVWYDGDQNGLQNGDGSSVGVNSVTVELFHSGGSSAGTTSTNSDGLYSFNSVSPGDYYLEFRNIPSGYEFTVKDEGINDALDSDVNAGTGRTDIFTLSSGETNNNLDAGIFETPPTVNHPDCDYLYAVADAGDILVYMPRDGSSGAITIGSNNATLIEATALSLDAQTLYASNADRLGVLDWNSGNFTGKGSTYGTGGGEEGEVALSDVDGLAFDPLSGILYGTHRWGDGTPEDLLFQINPVTGAHVPNAFGSGIDYVVIDTFDEVSLYDIDDIAISPVDGQMYGVINSSGGNDRIAKINKYTGDVTDVGRSHTSTANVNDVEGLAFHNSGTFYGVTGTSPSTMYEIDVTNALFTLVHTMDNSGDYESVTGLTCGSNLITGNVFIDVDQDGINDVGESGQQNVLVKLYRDVNNDGLVDGGDIFAHSILTNSNGDYQFEVGTDGAFVLEIDENTLPGGAEMTTDNKEESDFVGWGNTDSNNDFGYHIPITINPPPSATCDTGNSISWENNVEVNGDNVSFDVRFVSGSTTQFVIPGPYPSAFSGAVDVTISEAISWDGYANRDATGEQPNERFKVVFKKSGSVVWSSPYTGITGGTDGIDTGVISDEWVGPLGTTINLPNGADEIILVHWSNANYGENDQSNANSVVPSSVCIGYSVATLSSIGDYVWYDADADGVQDGSETGIDNIAVELYLDNNNNGIIDGGDTHEGQQITASGGLYEFINLYPGDYLVTVEDKKVLMNYNLTGGTNPHAVSLTSGQDYINADFGFYNYDPMGYIYYEATGEVISGGLIEVTGPGSITIVQDGSSGYYEFFTDGTAGTYTIELTVPAGFEISSTCMPSDPPAFDPTGGPNPTVLGSGIDGGSGYLEDFSCGSNTFYYTFELEPADPPIFHNNFPIKIPSNIQPPTAPNCNGGTSLLWQNNIVIDGDNVTKDVGFNNGGTTQHVIPGPYPSAFNGEVDIFITEAIAWDGHILRESTGDQPNERFRVVFKKNGLVVWASPYTGLDGGSDGIDTGVISDDWVGPLGYPVNLPDGTDEIILVHWSDETYGENDDGNVNSVMPASVCIAYSTPGVASIGDFVWKDLDEDGIQDAVDKGIENVTVNLFHSDDSPAGNTTTDVDGYYSFNDLTPGEYYLEFVLPTAYEFTLQDQGASEALDSDADQTTGVTSIATLSGGDNDTRWDAGLIFLGGTIGDYVWYDVNHDGLQNDGGAAVGLGNVKLTLFDGTNTAIDITYTDNNGWYEFTGLVADDYTVLLDNTTLPPVLVHATYDYDGIDSQHFAHLTLTEGETNNQIDFGYSDQPLPVTLASFKVNRSTEGVVITWITESEIENQGFIIERKENSNSEWTEIANYINNFELKGQGTVTYSTEYEYIDKLVYPGNTYEYRLGDIDYNGVITYHVTEMITINLSDKIGAPEAFSVKPAYPNPFNPSTVIEYGLPETGIVNVAIYDILGHSIKTLVSKNQMAGWHSISWHGTDNNGVMVPAGMYFGIVITEKSKHTIKLMYIK